MGIYDEMQMSGEKVNVQQEYIDLGISPGLPFPPSYVEFVQRFGHGLTCGLFLIYPPLGEYPDSFHQRSAGIKWALDTVLRPGDPGYDFLLRPDGSYELVDGLVGFATGESGESLFWDTRGGAGAGEYPIYLSGRSMGIRYGGANLEEFITNITSPLTFKRIMAFDSAPLPRTFRSSGPKKIEAWAAQQIASR